MNKSIRTEIVINASKERVWQVLTDFAGYTAWNPFIIGIQGDLAAGQKLSIRMQNGKKEFRFRPTVLSVTADKYYDWVGHLGVRGIFDGHHYFDIEELGAGQVKFNHGEYFSGILSGYILKQIADDTRAGFIKMNQAIKSIAEGGS